MPERQTRIFYFIIFSHDFFNSCRILCKYIHFVNKPVSINKLVCLFLQCCTDDDSKNCVAILFLQSLLELIKFFVVSKSREIVIKLHAMLKMLVLLNSWLQPNETHIWVSDLHMNIVNFVKHKVIV